MEEISTLRWKSFFIIYDSQANLTDTTQLDIIKSIIILDIIRLDFQYSFCIGLQVWRKMTRNYVLLVLIITNQIYYFISQCRIRFTFASLHLIISATEIYLFMLKKPFAHWCETKVTEISMQWYFVVYCFILAQR